MSSNTDEYNQMEAAGFVFDPRLGGLARWTNKKLGVTALRESWMNEAQWDKHRAEKIAEAARLRRFDELPFGARFKLSRDLDPERQIFVKLNDVCIVPWRGSAPGHQPPDKSLVHGELATAGGTELVVELFEPFDGLSPGELEELPKNPEVWRALADWHSCQSTMAEAQEYLEPMRWHDKRMEECRIMADKIEKQLEDG